MNDKKYIDVTILSGDEESQKLVLQSCIRFIDMKDNAKFTYRKELNPEESTYIAEDKSDSEESHFYQRELDDKRLKEIKNYIRRCIKSEHDGRMVAAIFPTALLLAFHSEESKLRRGQREKVELPQEFYIVDGQHRLKSMINLYDEVSVKPQIEGDEAKIIKDYLDKYVFNCTVMLNFDMWEQAQVFADVNFTQKKVSRSLYYEIYGMQYSESIEDRKRNGIYIAHKLVSFLNTKKGSPMYGKVKMLGKGEGLVSQACLVEALMRHIVSVRGIWYIRGGESSETSYKYMAVELFSYLTAVKETFPDYWPSGNTHVSILCRTTGIGAMIRLMGYIHVCKIDDIIKKGLRSSSEYVYHSYLTRVKEVLGLLKPEERKLFGFDGDFSGTGGKGLEAALYRRMKEILVR